MSPETRDAMQLDARLAWLPGHPASASASSRLLVVSNARNRVPDGRPTSLNPIRRSRCPPYSLPHASVGELSGELSEELSEELFDSRQSTERFFV
jgi:hypothetical protein